MLSQQHPYIPQYPDSPLAIVTGAGSGIGYAISLALSARQIDVLAIDCDISALAGLPRIHAHQIDVADISAMQQLADSLAHRPVQYVFANAGTGAPGSMLAAPLPAWQRAWDVNVIGVLHTLRCWWPHLVAGQGKAVATVSTAALQCYPGAALYRATKSALLSALESLHYESRGSGVALHALCPGLVQSNIAANSIKSGVKNSGENNDETTAADARPSDPFSLWLQQAMKTAETAEHFAARVLAQLIDDDDPPPFYWFTHEESLPWIEGRHRAVLAGQPFADFGVGP